MSNPARRKGSAWEVALLPRLRLLFGPQVERAPLKGIQDKGDFTGVPWLVEAKSTIRPSFLEWGRTARKKVGERFWIVWTGDKRTPGNGPYVMMPLGLAEELAEAWVDDKARREESRQFFESLPGRKPARMVSISDNFDRNVGIPYATQGGSSIPNFSHPLQFVADI